MTQLAGAMGANGQLLPVIRWGTHQSVSYTGTAGTISNAVSSPVVRILCTSNAYVAIGTSPTATTSDVYVAAGVAEVIAVEPGHKVSAVQVSGSGSLHVTEALEI